MKQSWSHRIFFLINNQLGKRPRLDRCMRFCGHDLLYFSAGLLFVWIILGVGDATPPNPDRAFLGLTVAGVVGFVISYAIAFLFPHPRPVREFPKVKELIEPLGTWKSFPSDHTIAACVIALVAILYGAPLGINIILSVNAILIALGRIWIGVHYPRDIIGGMIVAMIASSVTFFL